MRIFKIFIVTETVLATVAFLGWCLSALRSMAIARGDASPGESEFIAIQYAQRGTLEWMDASMVLQLGIGNAMIAWGLFLSVVVAILCISIAILNKQGSDHAR